jgi:hypothetical protein
MAEQRHAWSPKTTTSQDMFPPILHTEYVCERCSAKAWDTSQEGTETTRSDNFDEPCPSEVEDAT